MVKKKIILILLIIILLQSSISAKSTPYGNITYLPGSNIYIRIFLFFFPISKKYEIFSSFEDDFINLDIICKQENIISEPETPAYFDSNVTFHIRNIPFNESAKIRLPVSIRCKQKFIKKRITFTIYRNEDILILKGALNNLKIKEITENKYFKNRYNWKYPLYFDIRLQLTK